MARSTSSPSERGTGAAIIAISSLAGLVAALAGGLVAGGDPPKLLVGAAVGLVVGALGALGVIAVVDRRLPAEALDARQPAFDRVGASEPGRSATTRTAAPGAAPASHALAAGIDEVTAAPALSPGDAPARARNGGALAASGGVAAGTALARGPAANLEALVTSIGHRYQSLADRQLAALSDLADDEPENGKLALATRLARRMRRTSKTLQVLADDPDSREAAPTATIGEVIASAIADNDEFARIDYRSLHPGEVDGDVVPDVVHLLAELIDNAVSSSRANGTSVMVLGRRSADGYILSVVDEGSGMPSNQRNVANDRVTTPPSLTQQSPAAFGLPTVGRLAARHDITVTLLEAATDGVIAKVRLPARVMGSRQADPSARRAKDRPAVGAGAASEATDKVIDLTAGEARPAAVGAGPVKATADATVAPSAGERGARPDPSGRADLARQVQRNRSNAQEPPVRNSMQPASLDRSSSGRNVGAGRSPVPVRKGDAEPRPKDGRPDGRG